MSDPTQPDPFPFYVPAYLETDPFWQDIPAKLADDGTVLEPAHVAPPRVTAGDLRPVPDDVAALSQTRTIDSNTGRELGVFSESTRPTQAQVEDLIDDATAEVLGQLPPHFDIVQFGAAVSRLIAVRAAWALEASFYREAASLQSGPAAEWQSRFTGDLAALRELIPRATRVA